MTIDWWTLGLQTVNVLILLWILARFLFRPVAGIIAERQAAAHAALDEADAALREAATAREAAQVEEQTLRERRTALLDKAREDAGREKTRLVEAARAEIDQMRREARADLARQREDQRQQVAQEAGSLAIDIAQRLLTRLPEDARVAGFVDGLADEIGTLPDATRAAMRNDGPLRLRTARALDEAETSAIRARLSEVLGGPVTLEVSTKPGLLAGLELEAPSALVRNHLKADLDRIEAELTRHD